MAALVDPVENFDAQLSGARGLPFVTVPAFYIVLAFAAGISGSRSVYRPPALLLCASAIGMLCVLLCPRVARWMALTALGLAWAAAGMFCAEVQPRPVAAQAVQRALLQEDAEHAIEAVVLPATRPRAAQPEQVESARRERRVAQPMDLALMKVDGTPVVQQRMRATLLVAEGDAVPACGDRVSFTAKLHAPARFYTPGAFDQAAWLASQQIFVEGSVHADAITGAALKESSMGCRLAAIRNRALDRMDDLSARMAAWPSRWQTGALTAGDVTLLAAALLGDRSRVDPAERTAFQRVGAYHLLVVSGLSIGIFAAALWWLLRRLRCNRVVATAVTLTLLTAYAALTGWDRPVQRALLMTALYMLGRLLYRRTSALNTLSVAALLLLALEPQALFLASLQMTLLAVLAIAGIAGPLLLRTSQRWVRASRDLHVPVDESLAPRLAQFRVTLRLWQSALRPALGKRLAGWLPGVFVRLLLHIAELAFVSLVLELALAIPMAVYFNRVVALSVGANILTVPLLGMLLPMALLTVLLAAVSLQAALVPGTITALLLHFAESAVHRVALLPRAEWRIPPTRPAAIALALLAMLLAVALAHSWLRSDSDRGLRQAGLRAWLALTGALALLMVAGGLALWSVPARSTAGAIEVTALDVGQGDSIFVAGPSGATLLVDGGGPAGPFAGDGPAAGDFYGEDIVSPYLWSRGIRRLDAVALTHAHSDHMGGMAAVLRNFHPRELWVGANPPTAAYERLLAQAAALTIPVRSLHAGDAFSFGGAQVAVLAPQPGYQPGDTAQNDDSLVLHLALGATSVLLEGDAQRWSEQTMLASGGPLASTLLKVGHHGSLSSTTPEFLAAVHPAWAVVSAGRHNLYGHPRYPVVVRLGQAGARVYRTDLDGASGFLLDGREVRAVAP